MNIAEIDGPNPSLQVEGRTVKLLVCGEPKGILAEAKGFMAGVSVSPVGLETPSPHEYDAEELYMILDGKGEVFQGGETRKITKGSVIFPPSRVRHGIVVVDETITLLWILCPGGTYPHLSNR